MNTKRALHQFERGQSAVLVALALFAIMAMLALTFDGGFAYFQRRLAQTAADSGALAGARDYCMTGDEGLAATTAVDYAIARNAAEEAEATAGGGLVSITTTIAFNTAIGGILGVPEITVHGAAEAGCFAPTGGTGVLPVAWACEPPAVDLNDNFDETDDCAIWYGDAHTYIIMDAGSASTDYYCFSPPNTGVPAGGIDCDVDNDGYDDIFASGNRSWLDLNGGGGGSSELVDWVNGGYAGELNIHNWVGGQTGVANNVFQAVGGHVGEDVVLPVFDMFCDQPGSLPETSCPSLYHGGQDLTIPSGGTATLYYHIISFSIFHITCVDAPGVPGPPCPGKQAAVAGGMPNHVQTIEGYFVEGYVPGLSGRPTDGVYAGAFTLYLTR